MRSFARLSCFVWPIGFICSPFSSGAHFTLPVLFWLSMLFAASSAFRRESDSLDCHRRHRLVVTFSATPYYNTNLLARHQPFPPFSPSSQSNQQPLPSPFCLLVFSSSPYIKIPRGLPFPPFSPFPPRALNRLGTSSIQKSVCANLLLTFWSLFAKNLVLRTKRAVSSVLLAPFFFVLRFLFPPFRGFGSLPLARLGLRSAFGLGVLSSWSGGGGGGAGAVDEAD